MGSNTNKAAVLKMLMGMANSPNWTILTADKVDSTPEQTSADRDFLLHMLERKGWEYLLVDGYYAGQLEQAVFVIGMHSDDAISYALFFDQEAFLTNGGLFYRGTSGWYQRSDFVHRHVVDGELTSTRFDRSVIHCSDGDLIFMCEVR